MANRRRRQPDQADVEWNFISFPTLVGFVAGMTLACLLIAFDYGRLLPGVHTLLWYVSLIGISFSLAHVITRHMARRRLNQRRDKAEEDERERRALAARARAAEQAAEGSSPSQPRRRRRRRA